MLGFSESKTQSTNILRFKRHAYYKMATSNILNQEKAYELLEGLIFEMSPISPQHGYRVKRLSDMLSACSTEVVFSQHPLNIDDYNEPQPDILLLKGPLETYAERLPTPEDCLLIIEVSHTTLKQDRGSKLKLYALAGILEYWLFNLSAKQLEVYRYPDRFKGYYQEKQVLSEGEAISPLGEVCDISWWL
ncbi:MAG: Uma2 family endonuclease [Deinococcales bacterium]